MACGKSGKSGPLAGTRVVEFSGIGPGPFCGMLLADMGADVVRIDRPGAWASRDLAVDVFGRGKRSIVLDLKAEDDRALAWRLVEQADVLLEGFRPGVMERLGFGPEACLARRPGLVFGRVTGWGQSGPLASTAGHDLTYVAQSGALWTIGGADRPPPPPVNYVGDFGGGGLLLALGVTAALAHVAKGGAGQVVDAAMADGAALQATMVYGMIATGQWAVERSANLLDGGAPFYGTYECADGRFIAVAPIEAPFHAEFLRRLGLPPMSERDYLDPARWPERRRELEALFRTRPRDAWCDLFAGSDACVAPVLSPAEAPHHPHNAERGAFLPFEAGWQPAPAPRFGATPSRVAWAAPTPGQHRMEIEAELRDRAAAPL